MPTSQLSPVVCLRFESYDPDEAFARVADMGQYHVRVRGHTNDFRCQMTTWSIGELSLAKMDHSAAFDAAAYPLDCLMFGLEARGAIEINTAYEQLRLTTGQCFLYPYQTTFDMNRCDGGEPLRLVLPMASAVEVAAAHTGAPAPRVRFESLVPLTTEMSQTWNRTVDWVASLLTSADSVMSQPLVYGQVLSTLATVALATFPNNIMTFEAPGVRSCDATPAIFERAVEYIESNPDEDISLSDIATAVHCSARTLQYAFRRYLDTTPMGYLRRVRLDRAHHDLKAADPSHGDTVTEIASRWGFYHPSHFAAAYRGAYGRSPRDTLHN